jgi:hypothetical protein
MGKRKGDLEIGKRAAQELLRIFPDLTEEQICKRIGFERKIFWFWKSGQTPSGFALQRMCFEGCDVKYILTGRREKK